MPRPDSLKIKELHRGLLVTDNGIIVQTRGQTSISKFKKHQKAEEDVDAMGVVPRMASKGLHDTYAKEVRPTMGFVRRMASKGLSDLYARHVILVMGVARREHLEFQIVGVNIFLLSNRPSQDRRHIAKALSTRFCRP